MPLSNNAVPVNSAPDGSLCSGSVVSSVGSNWVCNSMPVLERDKVQQHDATILVKLLQVRCWPRPAVQRHLPTRLVKPYGACLECPALVFLFPLLTFDSCLAYLIPCDVRRIRDLRNYMPKQSKTVYCGLNRHVNTVHMNNHGLMGCLLVGCRQDW